MSHEYLPSYSCEVALTMSQSLLDGTSMSQCLTAGALPAQHSLLLCRLLQNAANSVLGQEIITYAKHLGIKTINVVRHNQYVNELKQKGCWPCLPALDNSSHGPSFLDCLYGSGRVYYSTLWIRVSCGCCHKGQQDHSHSAELSVGASTGLMWC